MPFSSVVRGKYPQYVIVRFDFFPSLKVEPPDPHGGV